MQPRGNRAGAVSPDVSRRLAAFGLVPGPIWPQNPAVAGQAPAAGQPPAGAAGQVPAAGQPPAGAPGQAPAAGQPPVGAAGQAPAAGQPSAGAAGQVPSTTHQQPDPAPAARKTRRVAKVSFYFLRFLV